VELDTGGMSDLGIAELPPPTRRDWGLCFRLEEMRQQTNLPWPSS
jgi:hypothetical protein